MSIDQITWVLRASMIIKRGAKAFSETDGARVFWTDVTHQRTQLAFLKGPIAHRDSGFECVPLAFGLDVYLPSKLGLGETRALIDLDLPDALFGLSELNRQIANAIKPPKRDPVAERAPRATD